MYAPIVDALLIRSFAVKPMIFAAPGATIIIPIDAPRNWFAPKRFAADIPTRIGKNQNGAADMS